MSKGRPQLPRVKPVGRAALNPANPNVAVLPGDRAVPRAAER